MKMSGTTINIVKASTTDIQILQSLCNNLYSFYFGNHWESEGLDLYLQEQFGSEKLNNDLMSPAIDYFFIHLNEKPIGFLKINYRTSFSGFENTKISELEKMYILAKHKGIGIGKIALNKAIKIVQHKGYELLFLEVLDTNKKAITFYEKIGFKYHSRTRLQYDHLKEEFKGLIYMCLQLT